METIRDENPKKNSGIKENSFKFKLNKVFNIPFKPKKIIGLSNKKIFTLLF